MIKENKYYIDAWLSKTSAQKIEFENYIDAKVKEYISLGLTVSMFRSGTFVEKDGVAIFSSRKPIIHFMKFIDVVDEWILHN